MRLSPLGILLTNSDIFSRNTSRRSHNEGLALVSCSFSCSFSYYAVFHPIPSTPHKPRALSYQGTTKRSLAKSYLRGTKTGSIYMHWQLRETLKTTYISQHDIEKFLYYVKRQLGEPKDGILAPKLLGGSITTAKAEVIFGGIEPETIIETRLSGEINFEVVMKGVTMIGAGTLGLFRVKTVLGKDVDLY